MMTIGARGIARLVMTSLAGIILVAAADPPAVQPKPAERAPGPGFEFAGKPKQVNKIRQSASGIACPQTAAKTCLVVFDEGVEARYLVLGSNGIATDPEPVVLLTDGRELDAEAAATDGKFYYVTGSHAAKRKTCASNPDSRRVLRLAVDPATGRARRTANGQLADLRSGNLWGLMATLPSLAPHVGERKCLGSEPPEEPVTAGLVGERGVDIEGLATDGKRLFFGFRGPTVASGTVAKILAVNAKALFEGGDAGPEVADIEVGKRRGIRDLHAVSGGLLVLAGPDDDRSSSNAGWTISFWNTQPTEPPKGLATLDLSHIKPQPCDSDNQQNPADAIKPEALTVVAETGDKYRVLILNDGMCDGGPILVDIPKPKP